MADDNKVIKLKPGQGKLIDCAVGILEKNVLDREELGFSTRVLVQCNLPHSNPGDDLKVWTRTNGHSCMSIQPRWYMKDGELVCSGYPYGNIPRLLLFFLCTQAVQTKSRQIVLGDSLSGFMRNIDLEVTGGRWGTINRFKDQMWRLLSATISFTYDTEQLKALKNASIASKMQLWWDTKQPDQANLFNSYVELTEEFYNEIMSYPVPVDMGIVSTLKKSPLALDLYTWLTYRVVSISKPTRISWMALSGQVGSDYSNVEDFVTKAKEALHKIYALWPELKIEEVRGGIILKPSKPSVPLISDISTK